jgi:hypothetical protein
MNVTTGQPPISSLRSYLVVGAVLVFLGSAASGGYSLYWFVSAAWERSAIEQQWRDRQKPSNAEAEGLRTIFGVFAGVGPLGMDFAAVAKVTLMERDAWKYLSLSLGLAFAGYVVLRRVRTGRQIKIRDSAADSLPAAKGAKVESPLAPQRPILRLRVKWALILLASLAVLSVMLLVWVYCHRPARETGMILSGDVKYIVSWEHYDLIREGMTLDEVAGVLDLGENRQMLPVSKQAVNELPPGNEIWVRFSSGDGDLSVDVKLRDGRVVEKKLHRRVYGEPPIDLHAWND